MRAILVILFTISLGACDDTPVTAGPDAASVAPATVVQAPIVQMQVPGVDYNGPWGPCDDACKGGFCLHDADGSFCAPPCNDDCPPPPVDVCGDLPVVKCLDTGACIIPCMGTDQCPAGMNCITGGLGFCVWS